MELAEPLPAEPFALRYEPVGEAVVERGVRYQVRAGNHVDTVACRNLVADLRHDVLRCEATGQYDAHEHRRQ